MLGAEEELRGGALSFEVTSSSFTLLLRAIERLERLNLVQMRWIMRNDRKCYHDRVSAMHVFSAI